MKFATAISTAFALAGVASAVPAYNNNGNNGQYNNGQYNNGQYNNGQYQGSKPPSNNGGYNNGQYNNGGYQGGSKPPSYGNGGYQPPSHNGGYQPPSHNGGYNNNGYGGRKTHYVTVGSVDGKNLAYYPPYINARRGDTVSFEFLARNHTVTQSDFNTPCSAKPYGFKTGFVPNPQGKRPGPRKTFTVGDDTKPVWFYCGQKQPKPHCGGGNAMVFAINPPRKGNTFERFQQKARAVPVPAAN